MVALLCFFLTLLASPFKSSSRLEAEKCRAPAVIPENSVRAGLAM
jgi:hypothetical protein